LRGRSDCASLHCTPGSCTSTLVTPLATELVMQLGAAYPAFQRLIAHWPQYAPHLVSALGDSLLEAGDAVTRQCGLDQLLERMSSGDKIKAGDWGGGGGRSERSGLSIPAYPGSSVGGLSHKNGAVNVWSTMGSPLGRSQARSSHSSLGPPIPSKCDHYLPWLPPPHGGTTLFCSASLRC